MAEQQTTEQAVVLPDSVIRALHGLVTARQQVVGDRIAQFTDRKQTTYTKNKLRQYRDEAARLQQIRNNIDSPYEVAFDRLLAQIATNNEQLAR